MIVVHMGGQREIFIGMVSVQEGIVVLVILVILVLGIRITLNNWYGNRSNVCGVVGRDGVKHLWQHRGSNPANPNKEKLDLEWERE